VYLTHDGACHGAESWRLQMRLTALAAVAAATAQAADATYGWQEGGKPTAPNAWPSVEPFWPHYTNR